ncbi:prephenate dehydrogenase [Streptoalloteichus tenebrarius]|uniref:prephenate dehydrogenase n=1 Tax=Streptoalloteichus tenebrarius (strain ATCC 17920 / DSM 40477 / JCM 4838 / CBS 697.72 / NBRC 16177 / NCIMB 11028 / NRRL B-12390 / A12253. 1 / ISP 5477) TaxID=1933 RepID=UPI003558D674|nr:prephenate dehydrogenase [Streptoalloteichus tenebrarius]
MRRPVCVLGLGLIGGSLVRAAAAAGRRVWGATTSAEDARAARAEGYDVVASTEEAVARAGVEDALVVLAVPLPAVEPVLREIASVAPECRLTDVVSVKEPVADAVRRLLPRARYVGGHPMAGTSASGWAAGDAALFRDAAWVVTAEVTESDEEDDEDEAGAEGDPGLWAEVARLALDCGARVVPATPAEHDAAVARVSHLPHVLAAVLAAVGADGGPLALSLGAGSFRDGTRVMGTRPELVRAMCEGNRWALLDAVDDALGRLGAARGALASTGSLAATVAAGHAARRSWERLRSADAGSRVRVNSHDLRCLVELGRHGGRVVALDDDEAVVALPE